MAPPAYKVFNTHDYSMVSLQINVDTLSTLYAFPYLKRMIAYKNSDWPEVFHNLRKAQIRWGIISKVLIKTGETVRSRGMIRRSVAQTVMLQDRESWVVMGEMLNILEGFHHRAARQIAGMTEKRVADRPW